MSSTFTIDIPGQFMTKDGGIGISATLTDVSFNANINYNLLSVSQMLTNGWKITSGDVKSIIMADNSGDIIVFKILVKTICGVVITILFMTWR